MGTKTLLNSVNRILEGVRLVNSQNQLTSLTDSARQVFIDQAITTINSAMIDAYAASPAALPTESEADSITLVTDDRSYALASDLVQMRWPLRDETNGTYIREMNYFDLVNSQVQPAGYTGTPSFGAMSPIDGEIYLDRIPTAAENGNVFAYEYDKAIVVALAADTFPFRDSAWESFMEAVKELWKRDNNLQFDPELYTQRMGNFCALISQKQFTTSYRPARGSWRHH